MISGTVEVPERLLASARSHNKTVADAVHLTLYKHLKRTMPGHFERSAASKYKHLPRRLKYMKMKARRYGSTTDLVKTGRTKNELPAGARIALSGSASGGTIRGRLTMRLPFGGGTGRALDEEAMNRLREAAVYETDPRKRAWAKKKLENLASERGKVGVTPGQMVKELQTVTDDEIRGMTGDIKRYYLLFIADMKRPRRLK